MFKYNPKNTKKISQTIKLLKISKNNKTFLMRVKKGKIG
jgi:hypothetical protein